MTATSPYLNAAARRISAQIIPLRPLATVHSVTSEYQHRFSRCISDGIPLEKTGPAIEPMWHSWLAGALTLFAIAVVWVVF